MLKSLFRKRLARFAEETDGNVTLEVLIVLPALLWLFGVGWVYFDVFRQTTVNQKANYVIGDMISRETEPLNDLYIDNSTRLLHHLTKSTLGDTDLRVTVVRYDTKQRKWRLDWSEARGDVVPLTDQQVRSATVTSRLPIAAHGDRLILVETWDKYYPVFRVGLGVMDIETYSFTRPRYAPQVLFLDDGNQNQNNGWGNGDQEAPGGSLCNNNAENADEGSLDPSCTNETGALNVEPPKKKSGGGGGGGGTNYTAPPPPEPTPTSGSV